MGTQVQSNFVQKLISIMKKMKKNTLLVSYYIAFLLYFRYALQIAQTFNAVQKLFSWPASTHICLKLVSSNFLLNTLQPYSSILLFLQIIRYLLNKGFVIVITSISAKRIYQSPFVFRSQLRDLQLTQICSHNQRYLHSSHNHNRKKNQSIACLQIEL